MRILLTNDDGIQSPGLKALADAFSKEHDLWVVAPEEERSGISHGITLKKPVRMRKTGEQRYTMDGTPVDCVYYSFLGALPVVPDIVISGINIGANLGTDILYSGTAAAAREAALCSVPGISVSLDAVKGPFHFGRVTEFLVKNLEIFRESWRVDSFFNVNAPNLDGGCREIEITELSRRIYNDHVDTYQAPNGDVYLFLKGSEPQTDGRQGTDSEAVAGGKISVSPVFLHPVHHDDHEIYKKARFIT